MLVSMEVIESLASSASAATTYDIVCAMFLSEALMWIEGMDDESGRIGIE